MIKGLKKVVSESKSLKGYYDAGYLQVNYNIAENEVWSNYHVDLGHHWHTYYKDENIIECFNLYEPTTMKDLEKRIQECVAEVREGK